MMIASVLKRYLTYALIVLSLPFACIFTAHAQGARQKTAEDFGREADACFDIGDYFCAMNSYAMANHLLVQASEHVDPTWTFQYFGSAANYSYYNFETENWFEYTFSLSQALDVMQATFPQGSFFESFTLINLHNYLTKRGFCADHDLIEDRIKFVVSNMDEWSDLEIYDWAEEAALLEGMVVYSSEFPECVFAEDLPPEMRIPNPAARLFPESGG